MWFVFKNLGLWKNAQKGKNGREIGVAKKYAKKICFITYFLFQ